MYEKELNAAEERSKIDRHDFRHKMRTIVKLIRDKRYEELDAIANSYDKEASESAVKRYCSFAAIDAVLASYIKRAENRNIKRKGK